MARDVEGATATPRSCCYRKNRPGISSSHPIPPDCSTRSCSPHQPTTPSHRKPHSRGDGLLLLHHGHVLIAKERNTPVPDRIRMRDLAAMMTRRSLGREASTDHSHEDGERAVDAVLVTLQDPQPARHRRVPRPLTQRRQETAKHEQPFQRPDTTETTLVPLAVWQLDKATAAILPIIDDLPRARPPRLRTQRPRTGHCAHTAAPHARRPGPAPPPLGRSPKPYPAAARATRGLELLPSIVPSSASTPNVPNNLVLQALDGR